jgi:RimJ/RimL family protein N-acetyltransferase
MAQPDVVGALIRDGQHRVFAQRRSPSRRLLPGIWDIVGGHVEPGETGEAALAREVEEETGWRLRHIEAVLADWHWEADGRVRHEVDYLVVVDGDLDAPRLEAGKHDAYAWVGLDDLELVMEGRTDGDRRLRDIVAKATRTRLTERLRLEPIGPEHLDDLVTIHADPLVAASYGGPWTESDARARIARAVTGWEEAGVEKWVAYDRTTGDVVGRGGVSLQVVDGRERHEVGWTLRSERWGEGLATEIGRAGIRFAFDHLDVDEVVAFTEPDNTRSRAVMDRLGMRGPRDIEVAGHPKVLYRLARGRAPREHA